VIKDPDPACSRGFQSWSKGKFSNKLPFFWETVVRVNREWGVSVRCLLFFRALVSKPSFSERRIGNQRGISRKPVLSAFGTPYSSLFFHAIFHPATLAFFPHVKFLSLTLAKAVLKVFLQNLLLGLLFPELGAVLPSFPPGFREFPLCFPSPGASPPMSPAFLSQITCAVDLAWLP